ncbi:MAG: hypothetical protein ACHQ50_01770 [Fimbriimonadales bacterium]
MRKHNPGRRFALTPSEDETYKSLQAQQRGIAKIIDGLTPDEESPSGSKAKPSHPRPPKR